MSQNADCIIPAGFHSENEKPSGVMGAHNLDQHAAGLHDSSTVADIAAVGSLQRDLNSMHMGLRFLDIQADTGPRGSVGGALEDKDRQSSNEIEYEEKYIQRLRGGIAESEREIERLEEHKMAEYEDMRRRSMESTPGRYDEGSRDMPEDCERRIEVAHSPLTSHVDVSPNASPVHIYHLPTGFTIHSSNPSIPDFAFHDPAIACHFPGDSDQSLFWTVVHRNHIAKYGDSEDVCEDCIVQYGGPNDLELEYDLKRSLAHHLDMAIEEVWNGLGHGETYVITDVSLTYADIDEQRPSMRGGGGYDSACSQYYSLADDYNCLYNDLVQDTFDTCGTTAPSVCTQAWMSVAGTLQLRNAQLERQLEELEEIYSSLDEDLKWNMEKLAELEEELETTREKKKAFEVFRPETGGVMKNEDSVSSSLAKNDDKSDVSNTIDYFVYFPRTSELLCPGSGQPIFHFPDAENLKDIHQTLRYRHEEGLATDSYEKRILEMMETREEMGILLPDTLEERFVMIGIPREPSQAWSHVPGDVEIAAWETSSDDQGEDSEGAKRMSRLGFTPAASEMEFHDQGYRTQSKPPSHISNMTVDLILPSSCSCEHKGFGMEYVPHYVSIRGGGGEGDLDDEDDDLEYDSDDESEEGSYDSHSNDDEVDHEDEAKEPCNTYESSKASNSHFHECETENITRHLKNPWPVDDVEDGVRPRLRGGANCKDDSSPKQNEKEEGHHPAGKSCYCVGDGKRACTTSSMPQTRYEATPDKSVDASRLSRKVSFHVDDGNLGEDDWHAYYEKQTANPDKNNCSKRVPCLGIQIYIPRQIIDTAATIAGKEPTRRRSSFT